MPTEPERDIEKQLRAYAKERREQAGTPLELHPATRKLLQGEAARLKAKGAGTSTFWSRLPVFWPRLPFGASIAAALMLACWLMLPVSSRPKPESKLVENLERSREAEINQPAPAAPPRLLAETPAPVKSEVDSLKAPAITTNYLAYDDGRRGIGGLAGGELASSKDIVDKKSKVELQLQDGFASGKAALGPAQNSLARDDLAKNLRQKEVSQTAAVPTAAAPALEDRAGGVPNLAVSEPRPAASVTTESVNEEFRRRYGRFLANGAASTGLSNNNIAQEEKLALQQSTGRFSLASPAVPGQQNDYYYGINPGAGGVTQLFRAKVDSLDAGARRYAASPGPNPVLNSFRVEQNGNEVRVIDGDDSVYTGQLQPAAVPAASPALDEAAARAVEKQTPLGVNAGFKTVARAADAETKPAQDYLFRVTGTNRSVNQSVVFTGRFLAGTNGNLRQPVGSVGGVSTVTNALSVATAPSLSNSRIEGQAVIGGTNQIQIIATPSGP